MTTNVFDKQIVCLFTIDRKILKEVWENDSIHKELWKPKPFSKLSFTIVLKFLIHSETWTYLMRKKYHFKIRAKTETVLSAKMLLCIIMLYAEYWASTYLDPFFIIIILVSQETPFSKYTITQIDAVNSPE